MYFFMGNAVCMVGIHVTIENPADSFSGFAPRCLQTKIVEAALVCGT